jgi:lipopolysaccharide/colanic/teichoic acid biosynthesis glycosyltransferase
MKIEIVATIENVEVEEIVSQQRESLANLAIIGANHGLTENQLRELLWTFEQNDVEVWFDASTSFIGRNRYVLLPLRKTTMVISDIRHLTSAQRTLKRCVDIVFSTVALLVLAPVILVAIAAIRIGGGNPLFKQQRVGVNGQLFSLWKLRTMSEGERPATPIGMSKSQEDPRITPVGRVLRRWSIDEIPQFVNVLKGDMSIVGPRPRLPEEVKPSIMMSRRLRAKPGITGLWQVSGRSMMSLNEADVLDVDYVDTWSFVSDAVIILRTIRVVISGHGAF